MTPRAIRRAAERQAMKLARISAPQHIPSPDLPEKTSAPAVLPAAAANPHLTAVTSPLTGHPMRGSLNAA